MAGNAFGSIFKLEGHFEAKNPWISYHEFLTDTMAKIVGAKPIEVVVMNTLTTNLHLLMVSFYQPTKTKYKIVIESDAFPSDRYAVQSQLAFHGFAIRIMKESGAHAVKLEGGHLAKESIERILQAGIPVMGHLGLTPQSIYKFGTYTVRAKDDVEAKTLIDDSKMLEKIGCFSIVLEKIPNVLAKKVALPMIGIGAGNLVDGQVLVLHDMLGMTKEFNPRFLRRYLNLYDQMSSAISKYSSDVKSKDFPNSSEQY